MLHANATKSRGLLVFVFLRLNGIVNLDIAGVGLHHSCTHPSFVQGAIVRLTLSIFTFASLYFRHSDRFF
ncbi:hypothetical protein EY666_09780 [Enterococcus faecalis]|uniref:Uncharacterized protein n=1 Tax=Enterococcus faecalis TaxID=1351 RepID=A0A4U3M850_ENTFL|nr:hypothetical protein EY666_09780 [Enterococcus faecalis]